MGWRGDWRNVKGVVFVRDEMYIHYIRLKEREEIEYGYYENVRVQESVDSYSTMSNKKQEYEQFVFLSQCISNFLARRSDNISRSLSQYIRIFQTPLQYPVISQYT